MKVKQNQKKQGKQIPASSKKNKTTRTLIFAGILTTALAAYMFWPSAETTMAENKITVAPDVSSADPAEKEKLAGRWQRTDGGYVIELKNPTPAGQIEAGYYNPNPINVGKAAWQSIDGKLMVMIELQDQNYPGSLYNLEFEPQGDKLFGTYFQAVERVSYTVEFVRLQN